MTSPVPIQLPSGSDLSWTEGYLLARSIPLKLRFTHINWNTNFPSAATFTFSPSTLWSTTRNTDRPTLLLLFPVFEDCFSYSVTLHSSSKSVDDSLDSIFSLAY